MILKSEIKKKYAFFDIQNDLSSKLHNIETVDIGHNRDFVIWLAGSRRIAVFHCVTHCVTVYCSVSLCRTLYITQSPSSRRFRKFLSRFAEIFDVAYRFFDLASSIWISTLGNLYSPSPQCHCGLGEYRFAGVEIKTEAARSKKRFWI